MRVCVSSLSVPDVIPNVERTVAVLGDIVAVWPSIPGWAIAALVYRNVRTRTTGRRTTSVAAAWLASEYEKTTFLDLERRYPSPMYLISAHMLLADVVGRNRLGELDEADRAFAWRAYCDFVVVDRATFTIIKVLEANGPLHLSRIQRQRDRRNQRILHRFGVQLETVGVDRPTGSTSQELT